MSIVPNKRPEYSREKAEQILRDKNLSLDKTYIIGIRGYFKKSMGNPMSNDRAIYDDAIFIISPDFYQSYNANVDAGAFRKGIANLVTGTYTYKVGIHGLSKPKDKRYTALVQAGRVEVARDSSITESGWFGINIHRGSYHSVSSLGCQTIYPEQWDNFISNVKAQLSKYNQRTVNYILIDF